MPEFTVVLECVTHERFRVKAASAQEAYDKVMSGTQTSFEDEVQSNGLLGVWDGDEKIEGVKEV